MGKKHRRRDFGLNGMGEEERMIHRFIRKLIRETRDHKLVWQTETHEAILKRLLDSEGTNPLPLLGTREDDGKTVLTYHSLFHPDMDTLFPVMMFSCAFPGGGSLHLVFVSNMDKMIPASEQSIHDELVVFVPDRQEAIPLFDYNPDVKCWLDDDLELLCATIMDAKKLPRLNPAGRQVMESYLGMGED